MFLQFSYVSCLQTLVTIDDIEFYCVAFIEGFKAVTLNGTVMYKHIIAVFPLNEAKTLFLIKPFYFSLH